MEYTYLLINIFTILVTFVASFDKRLSYYKNWKYLFPAIFITGSIFIIWDVWFTGTGVWSFNPNYLTGITIINLPLEEWLFFITVPYSCVFIYESMNYFFKNTSNSEASKYIAFIFGIFLLTIAIINYQLIYTFITFLSTGLVLISLSIVVSSQWLEKFFRAYLVHLIPFFIVNGMLTAFPVVEYNNFENLSIRLFTIPIEDSIYSMLLLIGNIFFFDLFRGKVPFNLNFQKILKLNKISD